MEYFAGLDVSLRTVNVCIVNAAGDVLLEKKIEAEPAAIIALLKSFGQPFKRIGLEAGPTSSWLYSELRCAGYPAICLECRHAKAGLSSNPFERLAEALQESNDRRWLRLDLLLEQDVTRSVDNANVDGPQGHVEAAKYSIISLHD